MVKSIRFVALIVVLVFVTPLYAEEYPLELAESFVKYIEDQGGLERARENAAKKTTKLRERCMLCHTPEKITDRLPRPYLSAQQPLYLIQQLTNFSSAMRVSLVMHSMTNHLTQEDIFNLALYFSGKPPVVTSLGLNMDPNVIENGKRLFLDRCQHCHGQDARGQGIYARLAGQHPGYLRKNLIRFRDSESARTDVGMTSITNGLTDKQIDEIALYLSTLN